MNHMFKTEEVRNAAPGWSVQFDDGTWLGGAHGWFTSSDAFYADIYSSPEEAQSTLDYVRKDKDWGDFSMEAKIIPAWQPLCERLRVRISSLRQANKLTPSKIFDITLSLEDALYQLRAIDKDEDK